MALRPEGGERRGLAEPRRHAAAGALPERGVLAGGGGVGGDGGGAVLGGADFAVRRGGGEEGEEEKPSHGARTSAMDGGCAVRRS